MFAEVVFDLAIETRFTYGIPDAWESVIVPGSRVLAPFGRKKITGYVVALSRHSERDQISPIHEAL
ncbi:MAG TPA: hypothetical protein PKO47_14395, partial [bacterium]|nr:hypothetical protein [bacterium]